MDLGELRPHTIEKKDPSAFHGAIVVGPPSAFQDRWARRFNEPMISFASGWMMVRQRAKQGGVELPLVISDHCDWPELLETIREISPQEVWVTHGREEALVRWCELQGLPPSHCIWWAMRTRGIERGVDPGEENPSNPPTMGGLTQSHGHILEASACRPNLGKRCGKSAPPLVGGL